MISLDTVARWTTDDLLALADPETTYRALRAALEHEYEHEAGPHACRTRAWLVAHQRSGRGDPRYADQHEAAGDRLEREGEEIETRYARCRTVKTALAILTGRYDWAMVGPTAYPCDASDPAGHALLAGATDERCHVLALPELAWLEA